jgi:hypothetical protein
MHFLLSDLFLVNLISFIWALNYVKYYVNRLSSKLNWPIKFWYELFSNCSNPGSFSCGNSGAVDVNRHTISCFVFMYDFFFASVFKILRIK